MRLQELYDSHVIVSTRPPKETSPARAPITDLSAAHLQEVLTTLRHGEIGDQLLAMQKLHDVVWRGAEDAVLQSELRAAGTLDILVQLVRKPNLLVQKEAAHLLWNMSAQAENARALRALPGALNAIIALLPSQDAVAGTATPPLSAAAPALSTADAKAQADREVLAPPAVATLRNLCTHDGTAAALAQTRAVSALLALLHKYELDAGVAVSALLVLWRMSELDERAPELTGERALTQLVTITRRAAEQATRAVVRRRSTHALQSGEGEEDDEFGEQSALYSSALALLTNVAIDKQTAERAGELGAVDAACVALGAAMSAKALQGPHVVTRHQLHAVWALANLLTLSRRNAKRFVEGAPASTLTHLAGLFRYSAPARLVPLEAAVELHARHRAIHKAALVLKHASEVAEDPRGLHAPALLPRLVGLLEHRPTSPSHALILSTLVRFAQQPEYALEMAEAGAFARLQHTLLSSERDVLEASVQLSVALFDVPEAAEQLDRGPTDAVAVLRAADDAAPEGAPRGAAGFDGSMIVDTLVVLLNRGQGDRRLVRYVVRAVRNLMFSVPRMRQHIGERRDAVRSLLTLAASPDERIQHAATSSLHLLADRSAAHCRLIEECDGLRVLIGVIEKPVAAEARKQAAQALMCICEQDEEAATRIDSRGGAVAYSDVLAELLRDYRAIPWF